MGFEYSMVSGFGRSGAVGGAEGNKLGGAIAGVGEVPGTVGGIRAGGAEGRVGNSGKGSEFVGGTAGFTGSLALAG